MLEYKNTVKKKDGGDAQAGAFLWANQETAAETLIQMHCSRPNYHKFEGRQWWEMPSRLHNKRIILSTTSMFTQPHIFFLNSHITRLLLDDQKGNKTVTTNPLST